MKKQIEQKKTPQSVKAAHSDKGRQKGTKGGSDRWKIFLPLLVIIPAVFFAFSPILDNQLTNWDDPDLITENPLIRTLDGNSINRIFTEYYFGNYQPLHLLSYAVEYHFYGLNPKGYHAVSLLLFLISCVLIYYFIFLLSKNKFVAIVGTLLFALNPMRVESVAWAAERKDMLYLLFFAAALVTYAQYVLKKERWTLYAITCIFFVLSVFSKVMAVSLVGALLMIDYYLGRKLSVKLVLEKIPFIILSLWIGIKQVLATMSTDTISTSSPYTLVDKLFIASHNLVQYWVKLIVPVNLSAFYPYFPKSDAGFLPWDFYAAALLLIGMAVLLFLSRKRTRLFIFSIGFFFLTIALVLQVLSVGPTMFSERYTLVPSIAFSFMLATLVHQYGSKIRAYQYLLYSVIGLYILTLGVLTFRRCDVWQTSLTLWDDVLAQFPNVATALNNRGKYYGETLNQLDKAMSDLTKSIQADPTYEKPYSNRGIVYCLRSQFGPAIVDFNKAIQLKPDFRDALFNRATAYAQTQQHEKAIADFTAVIKLRPDAPDSYFLRGVSLSNLKKYAEAIRDLNKALQLKPRHGNALFHRALANYNTKEYKQAFADIRAAQALGVKVDPAYFTRISEAAK